MRRFIALVALLGLLVMGWGMWWWHANRTLETALEEVRADGFYFDEDAYNAAHDLTPDMVYGGRWDLMLQASNSVDPFAVSPRSSNEEWPGVDYDPASPVWRELADAAIEANGPTYALLDQMQAAQFSGRPTAINHNAFVLLNQTRTLANLLADTALWHHDRGEAAEALRCWQQMQLLVGELRAGSTLIDLLVGIGIDALANQTLQQAAPTMNVRSTDPEAATVREIIAWLLDDEPWKPAWQQALRAETTYAGSLEDDLNKRHWITRPALKLDYARHLRWNAQFDAIYAADDFPTLMAETEKLGHYPWDITVDDEMWWAADVATFVSMPLSDFNYDSGNRAMVTHFRGQVDRYTTAISLAVALYRSDHGTVPASLDELVPDYLPFVPIDPYRADGGPLAYGVIPWPDGAPRPMIYSVSEDGVADIGAALFAAGNVDAVAEDWPYGQSALRPMFGYISTTGGDGTDQLRDLSMSTLTWPRRGDWSVLDEADETFFPPLGYQTDPDTLEEMPVHGPKKDDNFGDLDEFLGY